MHLNQSHAPKNNILKTIAAAEDSFETRYRRIPIKKLLYYNILILYACTHKTINHIYFPHDVNPYIYLSC